MKTNPNPGRRRLDPSDETIQFTVALPAKRFEALCRRAFLARRSVREQARYELAADAKKTLK